MSSDIFDSSDYDVVDGDSGIADEGIKLWMAIAITAAAMALISAIMLALF